MQRGMAVFDENRFAMKKALGSPALCQKNILWDAHLIIVALSCLLGSSHCEQQGSSARPPM